MIDVLESLVEQIRTIEGFEDRVYRKWPKTKPRFPCCLIYRISAVPTLTDGDGREIRTQLVYSADISGHDPDEADTLAEQVIDILAAFNFHRTGDMEFYDDLTRASRRVLTFMGEVDIRGNTYTN